MLKGSGGFSPAGLSVLVVDGDHACLKNLETILKKYNYQVKTSNLANEAAEMLRRKNERFDMVISDVNMSDMEDGFLFLKHVALVLNIPIIMTSDDGETSTVMKGVQYGACDYLLKPIKPKDVRFIWQHVYRKRIYQIEGGEEDSHTTHEIGVHGLIAGNKRGGESGGDSSLPPKKPRVNWTKELNHKFVKAVEQGGLKKVGPKKILELMGEASLTRSNVASHLQKYRQNLSKNAQKEAGTDIYLQQPPVMPPIKNMHQMMAINENGGHNNFQMVSNHINPYQGLNQCVQHLQLQCEPSNGYSSNQPFNVRNSQVQSESKMPQPHNYNALYGPPQLTNFPDVPQYNIPHTTIQRTNNEQNVEFSGVVHPQNRFNRHPLSTNFAALPKPVSYASTLSAMNEQNVELDFYLQNQIPSLPDTFGFSDPNTSTIFPSEQNVNVEFNPPPPFYPENQINPNGTLDDSDPNDSTIVSTDHTYPNNDSDTHP